MKKTYLQPEVMIESAEVETSILEGSLELRTLGHPGYDSESEDESEGGWAPKDNLWEF